MDYRETIVTMEKIDKNALRKPQTANRIKLIAIFGPSACGKTTLAKKLADSLGRSKAVAVSQDWCYKDWSGLPLKKREKINFDSPDSFDFKEMSAMVRRLQRCEAVEVPVYSYRLHKRLEKRHILHPKPYIIVEGLLVLHKKYLRDLFDTKIYVDIDNATALSRRIRRDVRTRGETIESVCRRYFNDVLPMQKKYVEKQKRHADIVVNGDDTDFSKLITTIKK